MDIEKAAPDGAAFSVFNYRFSDEDGHCATCFLEGESLFI